VSEKKDYVSDERLTLKLTGLRHVGIRKYTASPGASLEYGYKGHSGSFSYDKVEDCERMYKAIVAALENKS
jgi:hypothetical protein